MIKCYHVISKDHWNKEKDSNLFGQYELNNYGFIHSSTLKGLSKIIDRYLENEKDYLILKLYVDEDMVKYEDKDIEQLYPHFYSLIDKKYIKSVIELADF